MSAVPAQACIFLFQLGGPQDLAGIEAFLYNLFADVLPGPRWFRAALGRFIAWQRTPKVRPLYAAMGGGSPLCRNTQAQADALVAALAERGCRASVQVAMRYAPPRLAAALAVARALPNDVPWVALPLYPHFSYATTRSSLCEMSPALSPSEGRRLHVIEAYPTQKGYIAACADALNKTMAPLAHQPTDSVHVIFSAHGLPEKLVRAHDPYPEQVKQTVASLVAAMPRPHPWTLSYQSRVGPVKWLRPSTSETLARLGAAGCRCCIVVPVSFVSEHIETLQELDVELRDEAHKAGIADYHRVPTVGTHPAFIGGLADEVLAALARGTGGFAAPNVCLCGRQPSTARCLRA